MKRRWIPLALFAASAVLFGVCALLQFFYGSVQLGVIFAVLAVFGFAMFLLLRSDRVKW